MLDDLARQHGIPLALNGLGKHVPPDPAIAVLTGTKLDIGRESINLVNPRRGGEPQLPEIGTNQVPTDDSRNPRRGAIHPTGV